MKEGNDLLFHANQKIFIAFQNTSSTYVQLLTDLSPLVSGAEKVILSIKLL